MRYFAKSVLAVSILAASAGGVAAMPSARLSTTGLNVVQVQCANWYRECARL
jgi:hypothetical protein